MIQLKIWLCPFRAIFIWNISNSRKRAGAKGGNSVKCARLRVSIAKGRTDRSAAFPVCPIDRAKDFRLLIKIARALEFSIKRVATFPLLLSLFPIAVLFSLALRFSVARTFVPVFSSLFLSLVPSPPRPSYFPRLRVLFASPAWCAGNIKCNFAQRILQGYSDPDGVSRSTFSVLATFVECACTRSCHFCFRQRFRFFVGRYRKIFVASLPRCSRSRAIF